MEKVKINLIYMPQGNDAKEPRHQNEFGELWMNGSRKDDMYNISMSFYSANYPDPIKSGDSIYVIEPMCVSERDYEIEFIEKFKYIFTWADNAFKNTRIANKIISLNHPSCLGVDKQVYENKKHGWAKWGDRRDEITFIANNKSSNHYSELYSRRKILAQWLHNNSEKHKVSWYSQSSTPSPYFKGTIHGDKSTILNHVKFSICTENCYDEKYSTNYFTEKMPEVWFSGAVPIYMGCYNIDQFGFHPDSYIDLRKFTDGKNIRLRELLNEINIFDETKYNKYLEAVDYNINQANLFNIISEERAMGKMIETFYKERNGI
jgi:hypothetical protein